MTETPQLDVLERLAIAPRLSELDRALIRLLQEDGRMSYARMAAALGLTEKVVRTRVHQLRADGQLVITTVGDPELMGYSMIAMVAVVADPAARISKIAEKLADVTGAFYVMHVTGRYNVLVEMSCRDAEQLSATVDEEISPIAGVQSVEVFPYARIQYQNPSFEAARQKALHSNNAHRQRLEFTDIDREIIQRLHDDGRVPFLEIARALAISESQVRQRARRMIDAGVVRVMALTVPRAIGFETVALIGISADPGAAVETVAAALARLPAVIYVAICFGRFDIFAEVVCTDREDLLNVMEKEIRPVAGVMRAEAWIYLRLYYQSVRPAP